jgi:hypothetical protein
MNQLRTLMTLAVVGLPLALAHAPAQAQRDPTRPPDASGLNAPPPGTATAAANATAASGTAAGMPEPAQPGQHLMVINGKPYVVERGWLRGVGDKLGDARIERITAQEIWLRDANGLRKLPLYPQISLTPSTALKTSKTSPSAKKETTP